MDVREKANDKFSDSRFFIKREVSIDPKYNAKLLRRWDGVKMYDMKIDSLFIFFYYNCYH